MGARKKQGTRPMQQKMTSSHELHFGKRTTERAEACKSCASDHLKSQYFILKPLPAPILVHASEDAACTEHHTPLSVYLPDLYCKLGTKDLYGH
jgi:hypothetical protein